MPIGFKYSEESKRKMSLSHKGQRSSPETEIKKGQHLSRKTEFKKGHMRCFKTGKIKHSQGYYSIYKPEHPYARNKRVFEHRLIMEKHIGRFLKPNESVHHKNGIKTDNRIENLILFHSESKHQEYHGKKRRLNNPFCKINYCNQKYFAKGYCQKHYSKQYYSIIKILNYKI